MFKFQGWINVSCSVVTTVKSVKSTSRGSPIVFAKIIVNPSFDQCVPMTETAMTTCAKCKSMAAKINSIYPPNILASVVSCLEKSHVYWQVHLKIHIVRLIVQTLCPFYNLYECLLNKNLAVFISYWQRLFFIEISTMNTLGST